ncbi:hypothetical protein ACFO4E_24735 [Nocardiopsis mangrovi]|uniref:Peptide chain release factor 1 n=1 Tax=Nocardiopsis mangrovi TaxID=1179818 RepID=A0ABV9E1M8_9ACTN
MRHQGGEPGRPTRAGPHAMELGFLEPLYRAADPVATVYLDTTRGSADATHGIGRRWRALRAGLEGHGADEATLRALDGAVGGATGVPGPQGEALFASGGELIAAYTLSRPPAEDRASWWPVADPIELVADLDDTLAYVFVAADRSGADIHAYPENGGPSGERHFNGATLHISKVRGGGRRHEYDRRGTEGVWSDDAAQTVREVERAVDEIGAGVVFLGGDERAAGMIRDRFSERTRRILVEVRAGGRGDRGAMVELRSAVEQGLRETAVALRAGVVLDFLGDLEHPGLAVQGFADTAAALRSGGVGRLLLSAGRRDEPTLWASTSDPLELARTRAELTEPGEALEAPASALLLRAAQATRSAFTLLPESADATNGAGALLRFSPVRG